MSESNYRRSVMAAFRDGWNGQLNTIEIADAMFSAIRRGFEQAWQEGAKSCGILPEERTTEETAKLNLLIGDNFQYVGRLAEWIFEHSKANGYKFNEVTSRAGLWVNRYQEVVNVAKTMACQDKKIRWDLGNTERHCRTCLKLNGRVHRASVWASHNIAPRMITNRLACHGYQCDCRFTPTDQPATKGRFPNLP